MVMRPYDTWGEATTLIAHQLELCIFFNPRNYCNDSSVVYPPGFILPIYKRQQKVMSKKGIKISSVWSVLEVLKYSKRLEKSDG